MEDFSFLKVNKIPELENLTDLELVKIVQEQNDKYRAKCYWECPKCGYKVNYVHSLLCSESLYVHETKCQNVLQKYALKKKSKNKKDRSYICNTKMRFVGGESGWDSIHFIELFYRYQNMIVFGCQKFANIEHPEEMYSLLLPSFLKTTLSFGRDLKRDFSVKGDHWFSTFVWTSLKNRVFDVQKTNNYNKRNPLITCLVCGKELSKITGKHFLQPGHEIVSEEVFYNYGIQNGMCEGFTEKETIKFAKEIYRTNRKERLKIDNEFLNEYFRLFSNALVKNGVSSINEKMGIETDSGEVSDALCESDGFGETQESHEHKRIIERIDLRDKIKAMSKIVVIDESEKVDRFFGSDMTEKERTDIVYGIIHTMVSSGVPAVPQKTSLFEEDVLLDEITNILRSNTKCRMLVGKSAMEEVDCLD